MQKRPALTFINIIGILRAVPYLVPGLKLFRVVILKQHVMLKQAVQSGPVEFASSGCLGL
jgi:hypothetical protein